MVLQTVHGYRVGEDVEDLKAWLSALKGCPTITHTLAATCPSQVHGGDPGTWFYVEGDAARGLARRRCIACSTVVHVLDSEANWKFAPMWCCPSCQQSIAEVAFGVHAEPGEVGAPHATWLAMGVRCVACGRFDGVTDLNVPDLTLDRIAAQL